MSEAAAAPHVRIAACIPARWGSTRLPGKPLATIAGHSLLGRVIDQVRRDLRGRPDTPVIVATDDRRIADEADRCGCAAIMTSAALTSGSARVLAAVEALTDRPDAVLNVQGDTPFFPPGALELLADALSSGAAVATPIVQLDWERLDALREQKRAEPFSGTTCVVDKDRNAIWFSKNIIPAIRDEAALRTRSALSPVHRHVGIYGYRTGALRRFQQTPPSGYETLEGLEQLRFIHLGIAIRTVSLPPQAPALTGIDSAYDIALAERFLDRHGDPFGT